MDSIYWVISRDCNQRCPHCYNNSEPGAMGLTTSEVSQCVKNLPDPSDVRLDKIILSGGEVLVWPDLLFHTIQELRQRYKQHTEIWIQTNGDLLDEVMLGRLIDGGVNRIDVSSMDSFHPLSTVDRRNRLLGMFEEQNMISVDSDVQSKSGVRFSFWGATEDVWIGPLWPRGRARLNGLSGATPKHKFCELWSGAKNFLNYRDTGCEINLQLSDVYPCCPMTCRPIGNILNEPLISILDRCSQSPVFRALNDGDPESMGQSIGLTKDLGLSRTEELGNQCLWCDEFFTKYAPELLESGAERSEVTSTC